MAVIAIPALHTTDNGPLHCLPCSNQQNNTVQQLRQLQLNVLLPQPHLLMQICGHGNRQDQRQYRADQDS
ncbi:hypothetical protein D3C73_1033800 [compost metagenome]